jgi:large subunit ribosomal protein L28
MPCLYKETSCPMDSGRIYERFCTKGRLTMAKCNNCGKTTMFGHNRSFSQRATNRKFKPNLQKVTVMEKGRMVKKTLCAKCIKTLGKSAA